MWSSFLKEFLENIQNVFWDALGPPYKKSKKGKKGMLSSFQKKILENIQKKMMDLKFWKKGDILKMFKI